jgi:hypothetical protein
MTAAWKWRNWSDKLQSYVSWLWLLSHCSGCKKKFPVGKGIIFYTAFLSSISKSEDFVKMCRILSEFCCGIFMQHFQFCQVYYSILVMDNERSETGKFGSSVLTALVCGAYLVIIWNKSIYIPLWYSLHSIFLCCVIIVQLYFCLLITVMLYVHISLYLIGYNTVGPNIQFGPQTDICCYCIIIMKLSYFSVNIRLCGNSVSLQ